MSDINNQQTAPSPEQQNQQTAPQAIQLQPDQLQQIIAGAVQAAIPQQAPRTVNDMTPAERAEYLQIFDPAADNFDQQFVEALRNEEDPNARKAVLSQYRDGIINQALRGAELLIEDRMAQFQQQVAPAVSYSREQQAEKAWNEFSAAHPELKNQRQLVDAVAIQLTSTPGFTAPKNKNELFKTIAEASKSILSTAGVQFPANTQQQPQQSSQVNTPRMSQQRTVATSAANGTVPSGDGRQIAPFFLRRGR